MTSRTINFLSKCLKVKARQAKVVAPYPPKRNILICISNSNCRLFIALDSCECLQQFLRNGFFFWGGGGVPPLSATEPPGLRENLTDPQTNNTHSLQMKCGGIWLRQSIITENLIEDHEPWNWFEVTLIDSKVVSAVSKVCLLSNRKRNAW